MSDIPIQCNFSFYKASVIQIFCYREIFANYTNINPDLEGFMDDTMRIKTKDGVELWEQR